MNISPFRHYLCISSPFPHSLSIFLQPSCQAATSCATLSVTKRKVVKFPLYPLPIVVSFLFCPWALYTTPQLTILGLSFWFFAFSDQKFANYEFWNRDAWTVQSFRSFAVFAKGSLGDLCKDQSFFQAEIIQHPMNWVYSCKLTRKYENCPKLTILKKN